MSRFNKRQLFRDLAYDGTAYSTSKPWNLTAGSQVGDANIATEAFVTSAVDNITTHAHVSTTVYVDAGRAGETYTENGSQVFPYRTLSSAISVRLADGEDDYVVFQLAAGTYTGTISRDKATQWEQRFEIRGSGKLNTVLRGSTEWDATTGNVLYFRDFVQITIRDLSIRYGKYGIYTRNCSLVHIENVSFTALGSSGVDHVWGAPGNQAQMAAFWAAQGTVGAQRSNGGVCRIREAAQVVIKNCDAAACFRGFRLQNIGQGRVSGCTVRSSLESAYYCASSSYTAANGDGCHNMVFETCRAEYCFNNAFLIIGGYDISIIGCQAQNVANSAVMGWHTQDLRVQGCVFNKTCLLQYNGIGNFGDAWGCIGFAGSSGLIERGGFMLTALNNIMLGTGVGRHVEAVAFWFGGLDETLTSFRAAIDGNNTDLAVIVYKDSSDIPLTSTQYPAASGGNFVTEPEFLALEVLVAKNETDVSSNDVDILANTASITANDVDIAANTTNITSNDDTIGVNGSAIESLQSDVTDTQTASDQNTIDISTNAEDIGNKQDGLTWATVGDDHETNPVTSKNIKAYVDAAGGGDVYLASVNTFAANQEIKKNGNVKLTLEHTGYPYYLEVGANYGDAGITYVGRSAIKFNGNRISMSGGCTMLQMPVVTNLDTTNASHSCLAVKDDKLYFNQAGTWKQVDMT